MPLTKEKKKKILEDLKEKIEKQKIIIFVDFTGLKVKDLSELREKLREVEGQIKVTKKTLAQLAFEKKNLKIDIKKMKGQIAFVFGFKDEISPAKILWQFSQGNQNLKILGGILEKKFLGAEKIVELAKLPTREELLRKLVGSIKAPILNFVSVLEGNIKGLINILINLKTQMSNLKT